MPLDGFGFGGGVKDGGGGGGAVPLGGSGFCDGV